jgi:hypothetical protein
MKSLVELIAFFVPIMSPEGKLTLENLIVLAAIVLVAALLLALIKEKLGPDAYQACTPIAVVLGATIALGSCQSTSERMEKLKAARDWAPIPQVKSIP